MKDGGGGVLERMATPKRHQVSVFSTNSLMYERSTSDWEVDADSLFDSHIRLFSISVRWSLFSFPLSHTSLLLHHLLLLISSGNRNFQLLFLSLPSGSKNVGSSPVEVCASGASGNLTSLSHLFPIFSHVTEIHETVYIIRRNRAEVVSVSHTGIETHLVITHLPLGGRFRFSNLVSAPLRWIQKPHTSVLWASNIKGWMMVSEIKHHHCNAFNMFSSDSPALPQSTGNVKY